jgi:uncharacterized DUF497 family protein
MRFEWDRTKAEANLRKHGLPFDDALHLFDGPFRLEEAFA